MHRQRQKLEEHRTPQPSYRVLRSLVGEYTPFYRYANARIRGGEQRAIGTLTQRIRRRTKRKKQKKRGKEALGASKGTQVVCRPQVPAASPSTVFRPNLTVACRSTGDTATPGVDEPTEPQLAASAHPKGSYFHPWKNLLPSPWVEVFHPGVNGAGSYFYPLKSMVHSPWVDIPHPG